MELASNSCATRFDTIKDGWRDRKFSSIQCPEFERNTRIEKPLAHKCERAGPRTTRYIPSESRLCFRTDPSTTVGGKRRPGLMWKFPSPSVRVFGAIEKFGKRGAESREKMFVSFVIAGVLMEFRAATQGRPHDYSAFAGLKML